MSKQENLLNCINEMNAKLIQLKYVNEQQKRLKTEMAELYIALENEVENLETETDEDDKFVFDLTMVMDDLKQIMKHVEFETEIKN
jgi:hypothetical protein